jgi:hypothetical protein
MTGLDSVTLAELARLAACAPGYALRGPEFLAVPGSECGYVPHDWNGQTLAFEWVR